MTKQELTTWKQYLKNFRIHGCEKCPYARNEQGHCEYGPFFCDKDRIEVNRIRKALSTKRTVEELIKELNDLGIYDYNEIANLEKRRINHE